MVKWWYCGNTECDLFESVASADTVPPCPACQVPMLFVEENDLTQMSRLKLTELPDPLSNGKVLNAEGLARQDPQS